MGQKLVIGPFNKGLKKDRTAFVIDNDSFPTLINAYQWRGRVKRKRGTSLLGRLQRYFLSTSPSYNPGAFTTIPTTSQTLTLGTLGSGNLFTGDGAGTGFNLDDMTPNMSLVLGSIVIVDSTGPQTYTDPASDGILLGSLGGSGTINYTTGAFTITGGAGHTVTASFSYYPTLPVMGLEDLNLNVSQIPGTLAFDTRWSYNIIPASPFSIYDVTFYKNPATASFPGYIHKTNSTAFTWNGQDYQQFWTINYQGALWATNGMEVPFTATNVGMQYKSITDAVIVNTGPPTPGPRASVTLTIATHGLEVGDFVFLNEIQGITGINFQTGYVTAVGGVNTVTVELPEATLGGAYTAGAIGMAQYLTRNSDPTKDCIRFYDGDPTNGNVTTPVLNGVHGWVNFAPPLSEFIYSIADLPQAQYYLAGAKMIVNFKDRLLFLGPVIQTSAAGSQIYLQDTVIYSQNGTPYYTASFTGEVSNPNTFFTPILLPENQTATANAYFEDQTGFGGFITAGLQQPITTSSLNEDVLIVGFTTIQTRVVYTGNDIIPFNFFFINSELGSGSTFSAVNMDKGVISRGSRGYIITSQVDARRIDLEIPDEIFEASLTQNGAERYTAQRDFINEWLYFSYPINTINYKFPTATLQYNYRDDSWGLFYESYTTYGTFKKASGFIWSTVGFTYSTWIAWNDPWNSGSSTLEQPLVIAGNQQGYVIFREKGTDEAESLYIQGFSGNQVTSPNHCLNNGDFIVISDCLGTVATQVNGNVFKVYQTTTDTFRLDPSLTAGTYLGGGQIKRLYKPYIQTKQFPTAWEMGRKTRLGPQQYLFTTTDVGQIQLLIFLSQNADSAYNIGALLPDTQSINDSLIYSTVLYTCPESTNLGLTPSNINLNTATAVQQSEIWHRMNTSLLGDTVQIGFTMSDDQMRDVTLKNQIAEIELHGIILDVNPSQLLA